MAAKKAAASGARRRTARTAGNRREAQGVYFLSLTLENVRCFGSAQTLDLSDGQGRPRQWTVILGNNGVGKTTLLQALSSSVPVEKKHSSHDAKPASLQSPPPIARTRIVPSLFKDGPPLFPIGSGDLLRSGHSPGRIKSVVAFGHMISDGAAEFGRAAVGYFFSEVVEILDVEREPAVTGLCCFAYGATRRMGAGPLSEPAVDDPIATLFRDDVPLRNAEEWLLQADYAASKPSPHQERARVRRDAVQAMLIKLLPEIEDIQILADLDGNPARPRPGIRLKTPYGWVPLQGLSLGYKTLLAWMVDLASRLYERYPDSDNPLAESAVVLIDEIDLHLHPAWQRTLLDYLSQRFPNVQFIVTAHSPLVVQAATDANIVVLRREGDHVIIDNGAAAVRTWRVDQILTSDLFGLPSARPPALDALLAERRKILTKPRLSAAERRELERIEQELGELPTGETPEQMEAMDIIQRAARSLKKAGGGAA
jgi:energy-coupling factor transporter ATP-binding protein EcfA2